MIKLAGNYRRHRFQSLTALEAEARGEQDPLRQGYEEGYRQGQGLGFEQGLEEGRQQGRQQGYDTGLAQGRAAGEAAGRAGFEAALAPLATVERALAELHQQEVEQHIEQLCDLVEQVARRVIHAELSLNPDHLRKLVTDALERMDTRADDLTIFLSQGDWQRLVKTGTEAIGGYPLKADPLLATGDCRIESAQQQQTIRSEERLRACVEMVREELTAAREELPEVREYGT